MGEPLLTTDTCYHGSPRAARRKLATGIIRGTVNEGTPDARTIRFDLRKATGDFERETEVDQAERTAPAANHIGAPAQYTVGLFLWWWWWWPWWYWTWSPAVTDAALYDADGNDAGTLSGTLRIGLREREDAPEGGASSAYAIGCAADTEKERYSLGRIDLDVGSGAETLRVTSVYLETPPPSGRNIPRIAARKRKTAAEGVTWVDVKPTPGAFGSVVVSVEKEDPNQHPWAGLGYASKYALRVGSDAPRQGLRLWLTAEETYVFEAMAVPRKHPFHIGTDARGGTSASHASRLSQVVHSGVTPPVMTFRPERGTGRGIRKAYYQCTEHFSMGGEVVIIESEMMSPMLNDDETGKMVMYDSRTGECVLTGFGDGRGEQRFDTLSAALQHLGLRLKTPAVFRLGEEISPDNPDLCCAALTREGGGEGDDASGDDNNDDHAPVVLVNADGTHHCNHVHSAKDLRAWLQIHKPASSRQVCPMCDP